MAAGIEELSWILPMTIGTVVSFVTIGITKWSKMSFTASTSSVKIVGLEQGIHEIVSRIDKGEDYFRGEMKQVWTKLESITNSINLHEYRLNELQPRRKGGRGGDNNSDEETHR